jgi:hypothetical protein
MMKINRVLIAVNRIEDEHPSKEEKLGEDEKPHAQFGACIVPDFLESELFCLTHFFQAP